MSGGIVALSAAPSAVRGALMSRRSMRLKGEENTDKHGSG